MAENKEKIVPDTSVLINGVISDLIEKDKIKNIDIIVPNFVMEELQSQASKGYSIGLKGLNELKKINDLSKEKNIKIVQKGRRQTLDEIKLAKSGRIDALIVDVAKKENAVLYTCDMVQYMVADVRGIKTQYFKPYAKAKKLKIEDMLTPDVLSLHLKEGVAPLAKKGKPGKFKLVKIRDEVLTAEELENIIREIMDAVRYEENGFVEIGGREASVVQLGNMRIAITRPPFSDGIEVTVVKPIVKLTIDDYKIPEKLRKRIMIGSGILLVGPPGSGKSTLAASIAEFYESLGKIVKTLEQPRDLQVKDEITQYSKLRGDFEGTAELLLLVRPDYTIFDEVRTTKDFNVFTDMRLAGIGMVGVVHATKPIDAIQRFSKRVELGMIPHIIDTIIFIDAGEIKSVYKLSLVVRTPTGMAEDDLARPVVEVREFFSDRLDYEIYTYGEENVIIPVTKKESESVADKLAKKKIMEEIKKFDSRPEIEFRNNKVFIKLDNKAIPLLIGRKGKTIQELEKKLGIKIEVLPKVSTLKKIAKFTVRETGAYIIFNFTKNLSGKTVNFYIGDEFVFSAVIGRNGQVRINKDGDIGKTILKGVMRDDIKTFI
ncbi:MAG: Flp pilus assembly complex ATPase component TadA [Candidatus Aenigmarchaeota archaeon]|nr:Flp pilus assembly complex ATPase component TadA [Candidatus Aenigmarchaeota archaeon]